MKKIIGFVLLIAIFILPTHLVYANENDLSYRFCDDNFRNFIRRQVQLNDGEPLTIEHLYDVRELTLHGEGIRCLVGIEYLPNLRVISALDNDLTELDIRQNNNLTTLRVHHNFFAADYPHNIQGLRLDDDNFIFEFGVNPRHGTPPPHECIGVSITESITHEPVVPVPISEPVPASEPITVPEPVPIPENVEYIADTARENNNNEPIVTGRTPLSVQIPSGAWERHGEWTQALTLSINMVRRGDEWEVVGNAEIIPTSSVLSVFLPWIIASAAFVAFLITLILLVIRIRKS
ncbi:MAG: hypothetical protein FWE27_02290 [Defluviitaleaceae bacterium]|nr:hypothetical protein [Defluviitaleaceae bacterium]